VDDTRLRYHLVREHGRSGPEFAGLPLAELHRFEHLEQAMGLITLGHGHSPEGIGHRSGPAER